MLAYLSDKADKRIIDSLNEKGLNTILLKPFSALSNPVCTHADMLLLSVGNTLFVHRDYDISFKGFSDVIKIDEPISNKYPNDILLNITIVGKNVFANTKYASKTILKSLEQNGYSIHHVSQGYAHCSTCIVNDNAIITADKGIALTAQNIGIDVLLISEGHISLPPYDYGFIGGSCGSHKDGIYFCGSLNHHPDGEGIRAFCQAHEKKVIELCDAPLMDVGGILFI